MSDQITLPPVSMADLDLGHQARRSAEPLILVNWGAKALRRAAFGVFALVQSGASETWIAQIS